MTTATPTGLCKDCLATGLPILPVRYAVVPTSVIAPTAYGADLTNVNLGADYKYTLRALRYGYVYVYYETHPKRSKYWECYGVTGDGLLVKQVLITNAIQPGDTVKCTTNGHSNTRLEFFVIENPEQCGVAWVTYSSHRWTDAIRKKVEAAPAMHMQKIEPSKLIANDKVAEAYLATATLDKLKEVLDYDPKFDRTSLPYNTKMKALSKEDGVHDPMKLAQYSTIHPWRERQVTADKTLAVMHKQGIRTNAANHAGIVLELMDAEGIAEELNGYLSDINGYNAQYAYERALQISALDALNKTFTSLKATSFADLHLEKDPWEQITLKAAVLQCFAHDPRNPSEVARILETLTGHDDEFKAGTIPESGYKQQRSEYINREAAKPAEMEKRYAEIDQHRKLRWAQKEMARDMALHKRLSWIRDSLDEPAITTFNNNWTCFKDACDTLIDARAKTLITWLECKHFINELESYDCDNAIDGAKFQNCIAQNIFGLHTTPSGNQKLEKWVEEGVASKTNLVWRTFAFNQTAGIEGINEALTYAKEHHDEEHTLASLKESIINPKNWQRLVDVFKKGFTMDLTNSRAAEEATKVFGAALFNYNLRGTDKFFATTANKILEFWHNKSSRISVSEVIIYRLILNRGGVSNNEALRVMTALAKENKPSTRELLNFINSSRTMLEATPEAQRYSQRAYALSQAWESLKGGRNKLDALKDSRLTLAVMAVEMCNLAKLSYKSNGDTVSQMKIGQSAMSIASGAFDIWGLGHKALWGSSDWTYQKLKFYAGALSGIASFIGGIIDFTNAANKINHPRGVVPTLLVIKGSAGILSGVFTGLTTYTYSARFLESIAGKHPVIKVTQAEEGVQRALLIRGEKVIARRVLFMSVGLWLTLIALALEIAIVYFDDTELEKWLDKCAFGKKRAKGGFSDAKTQIETLRAAVSFEI